MLSAVPLFRRLRPLVVSLFDTTAWVVSYVVFAWLRFDQRAENVPWERVIETALGTAALYLLVGWVSQLHRGRSAIAGDFACIIPLPPRRNETCTRSFASGTNWGSSKS